MCKTTRPTFTEILGMDLAMAAAVLERLPTLEDGTAGKVLLSLFAKKR